MNSLSDFSVSSSSSSSIVVDGGLESPRSVFKKHPFTLAEGKLKPTNYINPGIGKRLEESYRDVREINKKIEKSMRKLNPEDLSVVNQKALERLGFLIRKQQEAYGRYCHNMSMLHIGTDYVEREQGKKFPFFLFCRETFFQNTDEKLREYLNKTIVLDPSKPFHKKQRFDLVHPKWLQELFPKEKKEQTVEVDKKKRELHLLVLYKEALCYFCHRLKNEQASLKKTSEFANVDQVDQMIGKIKKILEKNKDVQKLLELVSEEVSIYLEGSFQQQIFDKAAEAFLHALEKSYQREVAYCNESICKAVLEAFNSEKNRPLAVESSRAVIGGIITFLEKRGKHDKILLPPFKDPPMDAEGDADYEKLMERKVQEYVVECQKLVGEKVFCDDQVVINFSMLLPQFASQECPGPENESALSAQERIFNFLMTLEEDQGLTKKFRAFMNAELMRSNRKCMKRLGEKNKDCMEIRKYLLYFYRAPFQTYLNEPVKALKEIDERIFKEIYKTSIFVQLKDWKDDETKKIIIGFDEEVVNFQFLRRGAIGLASENLAGVLVQDLSIMVSRPRKYETEIKDPVKLRFYCEKRKDLTREEEKELNRYLGRIAFILKMLKFPPLEIREIEDES